MVKTYKLLLIILGFSVRCKERAVRESVQKGGGVSVRGNFKRLGEKWSEIQCV